MHYFTFVMLNGSEASSPPCERLLVALRRSFTIVQDDKKEEPPSICLRGPHARGENTLKIIWIQILLIT
jgi:hypothetical protein